MAKGESPLTNLLASLSSNLAPAAMEAAKAELDRAGDETYEKIKAGTPVRTGALKASLRKERVEKRGKYGTRIYYDGYDEKGTPYQLIANSLNKGGAGTGYSATHHIDEAVKDLKGLDGRIAEAVEKAIEEETKKGG